MRKLNDVTKDSIKQTLKMYIDDPSIPPDGKQFLLQLWIIGLLENVDEHGPVWFVPAKT